jgi:hypothetical protein
VLPVAGSVSVVAGADTPPDNGADVVPGETTSAVGEPPSKQIPVG